LLTGLQQAAARALTLVSLAGCGDLQAHDFWVEPREYWMVAQTPIPLTLQVGHGPFRQRSPIHINRIKRFEAIAADGSITDLRSSLHPGAEASDGDARLRTAGTCVLILETDNNAQSHLPAIRFNDYLRAEGLTLALEQRERTGRTEVDGSESYSRVAKAIIEVRPEGAGPPATGHALAGAPSAAAGSQVTRPLGLPLEIVPEWDPYAEPRPAGLAVQVLYRGHPLSGALVKLTDLAHDAEPLEKRRTDAQGHATFEMPRSGRWLMNVVWTQPLPESSETDFETVFSSLSFEVPPPSATILHPAARISPHD
jgi:uncharacterized GH25 family protein